MVLQNALNSYQKAQVYDEMDPHKLIFLLYEGAIKRIKLARQGVVDKDPKKRGENLGKAIAIVSELNASLDDSINTEEIQFLRGLYTSMLIELPKVSVTNDITILDRSERYLNELKRIWETNVMNGQAALNPKSASTGKKSASNGYATNNPVTGSGSSRSFAL